MGLRETELARLLEALSGRQPWPESVDADQRARAERLLDRARSVHAEAPAPKRALRGAMRIFRADRQQRTSRPGLLRLVFDSWLEPAPAVRGAGGESSRFLRFDGACRLEIQVRSTARGVELFGQVDPSDAAREARAEYAAKDRRVPIDPVGSFHFPRLPHGPLRIWIGDVVNVEISA